MVVGFEHDAGHQERLIPYVWDHIVKGVDLHRRRITVAWSEDYDR
jgi:ribosomal 30S subunit maturation factor RimM